MKTFIILTVLLASVFQVRSAEGNSTDMVTTEETSNGTDGNLMKPMISCKECNPDEGIKLMCETNDLIGDYVWEKNGEVLPDKNSATLEPSMEGNYTCQTRKDEKMSMKSMMLALTMNSDSKLAKMPMMPMLKCEDCPGEEVSLVCNEDPDLNGTSGVAYVWKKDGKLLKNDSGTMMKVMVEHPGNYTCMTQRSNVTSKKSNMLKLMKDDKTNKWMALTMKSGGSGNEQGTTSPVTTTMSSGRKPMKPTITFAGSPHDVKSLMCKGDPEQTGYVWKINDIDQDMDKKMIEPTKEGKYICMTKKGIESSPKSDMLILTEENGKFKSMTATTTTTETTTPELPHQQQANQTQPPNMQTTGVEPTTMTKKSVSNGSNGGISSNPPGSEGGNGGDDENKGDMTTGGETENAAVSLNRNSASILNTILAAVAVTTLIRSQLA